MYDPYDIINLFGDKYWTYECPEGGTPSLICANKLQQYTMYKIVITHYDEDNKESTLQVPYPTEIEFKVEGINNEYIHIIPSQEWGKVGVYTLNLNRLDYESLSVDLVADGEILESRILTEHNTEQPERVGVKE